MLSSALNFLNRAAWLALAACAGLVVIAASMLAAVLGRIDVLALVAGLLLITLIAWHLLHSKHRQTASPPPSLSSQDFSYYQSERTVQLAARQNAERSQLSNDAYAAAKATRPILSRKSLDDDTKPRKDDTRPKKPVQPVIYEETRPIPVVQKTAPPARVYPDLSDPYANLFPPPQPGEEDYLEYACDDQNTPAAGVTPPKPAETPKVLELLQPVEFPAPVKIPAAAETPELVDTSASTAIGVPVPPEETQRDDTPPPDHLPL